MTRVVNSGDKKNIGICIPTYNRAEILNKNIQTIIKSVGKYQIPIYVSDNASTDKTSDVIVELQGKYHQIIYNCNEANLGSDRNFEIVLKMCKEPYAWLLGDDDTIDNDICKLLDILDNEKPDLVFLTDKHKEGQYTDLNIIFRDIAEDMSWMSTLIISRDIIWNVDAKRYFNTHFLHMGLVLDYLGSYGMKVFCVANNYVYLMRPNYIEYINSAFEIYAKGWTELIIKLPGLTYEEKLKHFRNRNKYRNALNNRQLLSLRAQGVFNWHVLKEYREYIKLYNRSPYIWLFLISLFPPQGATLIRNIYQRLFKNNKYI